MFKITDYCGLVSGHDVDKSELFETFYGKLGTAPMITACPINIECKLIRTVELVDHEAFIGQIVAVYSGEEFLTDDRPDVEKINPLVFSMHDCYYRSLGKQLARAWEVGRGYIQNKK
jgi:flavin reductase (DIM6/NTAB) family NADH-FMN oxidoreductase RutF